MQNEIVAVKKFSFSMEWQAYIILCLSLLAMLYVQIYYPFFHPGGVYISYHSPGMAIFLILSGVIGLDSWNVMIILYALMSATIPYMIYLILRPYHKTYAMIGVIIVILGAVPYVYSKVDSYEQLFLFFEFVAIYLITQYFRNPKQYNRYPYYIIFIFYIMTLVKPTASFLFILFFLIAADVSSSRNKFSKKIY